MNQNPIFEMGSRKIMTIPYWLSYLVSINPFKAKVLNLATTVANKEGGLMTKAELIEKMAKDAKITTVAAGAALESTI